MSEVQRHLTDEELDAVMMGAESHAVHLEECAVCGGKLAEMRAMVACFREGMLQWEMPVASATISAKTNPGFLRLRAARSAQDDDGKKYGWMLIPAMGLAAMLVVGVMVPRWMHERHEVAQGTAQQVVNQPAASAVVAANIAPTSQKQNSSTSSGQVVGRPVMQAERQPVQSDAALMQQVQQQLDEDVPASMTPLTALIQSDDPHRDPKEPMPEERMN